MAKYINFSKILLIILLSIIAGFNKKTLCMNNQNQQNYPESQKDKEYEDFENFGQAYYPQCPQDPWLTSIKQDNGVKYQEEDPDHEQNNWQNHEQDNWENNYSLNPFPQEEDNFSDLATRIMKEEESKIFGFDCEDLPEKPSAESSQKQENMDHELNDVNMGLPEINKFNLDIRKLILNLELKVASGIHLTIDELNFAKKFIRPEEFQLLLKKSFHIIQTQIFIKNMQQNQQQFIQQPMPQARPTQQQPIMAQNMQKIDFNKPFMLIQIKQQNPQQSMQQPTPQTRPAQPLMQDMQQPMPQARPAQPIMQNMQQENPGQTNKNQVIVGQANIMQAKAGQNIQIKRVQPNKDCKQKI